MHAKDGDVSSVEIAKVVEDFLGGDDNNAWLKARDIAEEILRRYELTRKPKQRKAYGGKPRGGGIW